MGHRRFNANAPGSWRFLLALLCVLLVVVCGTVQVVHTHPLGDRSRADCALCVTAHVVVQISTPPPTLHASPVVSIVEAFAPASRARTLSIFALFTRPPPVDASLA